MVIIADDIALQVPITADPNPFKQAMGDIKNSVSGAMENVKNSMQGVREAFGAAGLLATNYLKGAVESAAKAEESTVRLKKIVENQGQSWETASKQVSKFTSGILDMSTYSGGQAKEALTVLEQKGVKLNDALKMQSTLVDLAAGKNIDLSEASNILADAYNGKTRALLSLGLATKDEIKNGISFDEVQKRINERFGGSAAAQLNTYSGQMKQFSNEMNSLKSSIGSFLLPYFTKMATYLDNIAKKINALSPENKKLIAEVLSMTAIFGTLIGGASLLQKTMSFLGPTVQGLGGMIGSLMGPLGIVIAGIALFTVAYTKNLGGFKTFIDSTIGSVIQKIKALSEAIQLAWNGKGNVGVLEKAFGKSSATIRVFMNAIIDSIKAVSMIIHGNFLGAINLVSEWFEPGADQGAAKIVKTTVSISLVIRNALSAVVNWVKTNWPAIKATFENVLKGLEIAWNTILKPVLKFMLDQISQIVQWVKDNWPLIKLTITTVINAVYKVITDVLSAISSFWKAHGETIKTIVVNDFNIIKAVISTVIKVVEDVIKVAMNLITGNWKGAFQGLINIVKDIFGGAVSIIKSILSSIGAVFSDIIKSAYNWGANLINGFIDGVKSKINAVKDAVHNVIKGVKDFMGFNSPAKEGEGQNITKWGANMIGGFMDGIKSKLPEMQLLMKTAIQAPNFNEKINGGLVGGYGNNSSFNSTNIRNLLHADSININNMSDWQKILEQMQFYMNKLSAGKGEV